jgi:hypothetical protein
MTGVEILAEEIVYKTNVFNSGFWIAAGITFVSLVTVVIISCIQSGDFDSNDFCGILLLLLLAFAVGILAGIIVDECSTDREINYIKYQVTIDDSVFMNEFLDKYEILDQEGKIYTVRERD